MNRKTLDTIMYIVCLVLFGLLLFNIADKCYGANVTDDNKGNKGYILINNGKGTGHQGTWTDIKTVPELKGEKGDKGDTGAAGIDGLNGEDGYTPIKGVDYVDGKDGIDGVDVDPVEVKRLDSRIDTNISDITNISSINKTQDKKLQDHTDKINDLDNRVGNLERTNYKIQTEFRIIDTRKISVSPYLSNNITRHKLDEAGIRITIKIGSSFEEREIAKTNKRLERLENKIGLAPVITKTLDNKGRVKSIELSNGWNVKGDF